MIFDKCSRLTLKQTSVLNTIKFNMGVVWGGQKGHVGEGGSEGSCGVIGEGLGVLNGIKHDFWKNVTDRMKNRSFKTY